MSPWSWTIPSSKQKMDSALSGDRADVPSQQEVPEARGWEAKVRLPFWTKRKQSNFLMGKVLS